MAPIGQEPKHSTAVHHGSDGSVNGTMNDAENGTVFHHPQYPTSDQQQQGYKGTGGGVSRFITPGGNPVDTSNPAFPIYHRRFGNPSPLGLLGFGATTFILSMYNVRTRNITHPNVVLGMALGYGGLVQLIAGIQEWACGNTFAATAFSSYGGFWLSYGTLYIPFFEVSGESLPLTWSIAGNADDDSRLWKQRRIRQRGRYLPRRLGHRHPALLHRYPQILHRSLIPLLLPGRHLLAALRRRARILCQLHQGRRRVRYSHGGHCGVHRPGGSVDQGH